MKYFNGSTADPASCCKQRSVHNTAPSVVSKLADVSDRLQVPSNSHCAVRLRVDAVIIAARAEILERSIPECSSASGVCKKDVCKSGKVRTPFSDRHHSCMASRSMPLLFSDSVTSKLTRATDGTSTVAWEIATALA